MTEIYMNGSEIIYNRLVRLCAEEFALENILINSLANDYDGDIGWNDIADVVSEGVHDGTPFDKIIEELETTDFEEEARKMREAE